MSEENKDLKKQAAELGQTMYESFEKARKEAEKAEKKAEAEKAEKAEEKQTKTADYSAVSGLMNKEYGISESAFDRVVQRDFSPEVIRGLVGPQGDEEKQSIKVNRFFRALVGRQIHPEVNEFHMTVKALSEGTDADGGYLVDPEFRGEVLRQLHQEGIMRPEVDVVPTNKDQIDFNYEDGRPTVSWGSENTAINTTTAGLNQKSINVHRMNSIMYMSREVVADSDPSITDWIRSELVTAMRQEEDAVIINGSGSGRPKGIDQISWTSNAAGASLTFEDYIDLMFTLPISYRNLPNTKFFMNSNTLRDAYKIKDDQGMPIYLRDLSGSTPGTLLGRPIVVHDFFADGKIFFGDLKRAYKLLDRQSLAVETTTEGGDTWQKHQVGIKIFERIGGDAVRSESVVEGTGYSA